MGGMANSADPDHLGLRCLYMLFCPNMWGHCGDVNPKYMIKNAGGMANSADPGSVLFVHTPLSNTTRTNARRRVCAAMVPYR